MPKVTARVLNKYFCDNGLLIWQNLKSEKEKRKKEKKKNNLKRKREKDIERKRVKV